MKKTFKTRTLALLLVVLMFVSILPIQALAALAENLELGGVGTDVTDDEGIGNSLFSAIDESDLVGFPNTFRNVSTSQELEAALSEDIDAICVTADFVIDRTFYVKSDTIVYSESAVTLTRSPDFAGDVFVVGQDSENNLCEEPITFSIGGFNGETSGGLTINGNSENMTVDVVGTVIFVCPAAQADLYDNLTITNCKKVGNERALNAIYGLSNTANVGGAVAILSKDSTMNVYGGAYTNNSVNTSGGSIYGGAFYNFATMHVYGGLFEGNSAVRAGAFYNYRSLYIYAATIQNNSASTAGGAIYLPASTAAKLYLGGNNELIASAVSFIGNTAGTNGGAVYTAGRISAQDAMFEGNSAEMGGAVYVNGDYAALSMTASSFQSNSATETGGAIYIATHNTLDIANDLSLLGVSFVGNTAKSGGAIGLNTGSFAYFKSCSFRENSATGYAGAIHTVGATLEIDKAEFIGNSAASAGAIYLSEATTAVINKLDAQGNTVTSNGGTLYSSASTLKLYNSSVKAGVAKTGSAAYLAAGAATEIYGSSFTGNTCLESNTSNAAAIFVYTNGAKTVIHSSLFAQNSSSGLGGALVASNKSILDLYNITVVDNSAAKGGFLYATTTGTTITVSGLTVSGNTASVGGPIIWGNSTGAKLYINKANYVDLDVQGALPADYWSSAIVNSLKVYESDATIPTYTDYNGEMVDGLWNATLVKNFDELKAAILAGKPYIKVVNDIEISETLYITSNIVIFSTTPCVLKRADGFKGSLLVVGRNASGALTEVSVALTLGLSTSAMKDFLNISCGEGDSSAIVVAGASEITLYDNVTISGAVGADASMMAVEENAIANIFGGTYRNNVSTGNGVVLNNGTLNLNGGVFSENSADQGGAIYNLGTLHIQSGAITKNTARLGGAVYNLGTMVIDGGDVTENCALESGGAIYMAGGNADLRSEILGNTAELGGAAYHADGVLSLAGASFTANSATKGGAVYLDGARADATWLNTTFVGNTAELGGAIYMAGADFDVNDCIFTENSSTSGGAIYVENATLSVSNTLFRANAAANGGAIYSLGSPLTIDGVTASLNSATQNGGFVYATAAKVAMANNALSKNEADRGACVFVTEGTLVSSNDTFEYGYAFEGGAIYAERSEVTVSASVFTSNDADYNGGAIALSSSNAYINSSVQMIANDAANNGGAISAQDSKLTVYSAIFRANTASMNGGALAAEGGSVFQVQTSILDQNSAQRGGGAVYVSDDGTVLVLQLCELTQNEAVAQGGAVYVCNKATASIYSVTATANHAARGGVLYMTGDGTVVTVNDVTLSSNTATTGAFIYGNGADSVLYINKSNYTDTANSQPDEQYWESALYGTMTVKSIYDDAPEYVEEGNEPAGDLGRAFDVSSAQELEAALLAGRKAIRIVADFEIDRTFYITYSVTIFSTARHTLKRAPHFAGDLFVVGERADGTNSMLDVADDALTLGNPLSTTPSLLTIDGNRENMTVDVMGTVLFICNGAVANVYENISIVNCHKVGNERTYEEKHKLSRPNRIGGPVAIIPFGALNVFGGRFANNSVAIEDSSSEETRNSTLGGVFYNESNLKIYGGLFENNEGARGGIVYNYGSIKMYGGSFIANRATVSGAVYYSPSSAACQLNIGYRSTTPILFKDNVASTNGGVIYSGMLSAVVIYGNTTFEGNKALSGSGGAIYTNTTLTVMNAVFNANSASGRGGAIFVTKTTEEQITRIAHLENSSFVGNSAANGGAVSLYCSNNDFASGSIVTIDGCDFVSNSAASGGAFSVERKSSLTVKNSGFDANTATGEAGVAYVIGESTVHFNNSVLSGNSAASHGGAFSVRSATLTIDNSILENNTSEQNGGAIYVAYSSSIDRNAKVTVVGSTIKGNSADNGGAIYATRRAIENDTKVLEITSSSFAGNVASDLGGAILLTASVDVFMRDVTFVSNSVTARSDGSGGAIAALKCTLEIDGGVFTKNTSACMGGAIHLASEAKVTLNNIIASRNTARTNGGFLYSSFAELTVYNSTVNNNSANMGAGMYLYEGATSSIYSTQFTANKTTENGAAMFVYTYGTKTVINGCSFERNHAAGFGGGLYVSGQSLVDIYHVTAVCNSAGKGGFMYETTAGTVVNLASLTVSENTSVNGGDIIWGNTKNATLNIDKEAYADLDTQGVLDDAYWAGAIANALTVNATTLTPPAAGKYTGYVEPDSNTVGNASSSVNDVFDLAINSSDGFINSTYDKFPVLDNSSNFMSRGTTVFENINGKTVTVDTYVYPKYATAHNMTVGEALMIYQAMLYKRAYPEEEVYIDISAYRFSVQTAVNINRDSRYFGYTRALINENYDEFGFVRVAYLLLSAAKMGIHVNVLAHRDAYPIINSKVIPSTFEAYFAKYSNDYCDPAYAPNATLSDYLTYEYFDWTLSGGGKGGTDMMHTKLCAVSHYIDMNGEIHRNAVWTSSSNLDGINTSGYNANWKLQTATIVSDHEDIYRISVNYLRLMPKYGYQEGIIEFQNLMNVETTKQIDLILAGKGNEIPEDERLVYIGTENDDVFELYFTPFGGDILSWNEKYNPYCKYLRELYDSEDYIVFTWNAAEYSGEFPLGKQIEQMIIDAFHKNKNPNNKIYANMESFDPTTFDDLVVGVDIGFKSINRWPLGAIHNKDLQFSYVKNGQRYYVSLLNSLNLHSGSMYYQSNSALVIKETSCSENSVFSIVAKYSTNAELVDHTFTDTKRVEPTETEHGYVYKVCACCGHEEVMETLHFGGEWIVQKIATPQENGIRYRKCLICDEIIEAEETKCSGSSFDPNANNGMTFTSATAIPVSVSKVPLTFEATILLDKTQNGRGGIIVGNYRSGEDENAINLEIHTDGRVRLFYITNGIRTDILFGEDVRSTKPVHIAVTIDGSCVTLYVNGVFSQSVEVHTPLPKIDKDMRIGADNRTKNLLPFKGKIYSVALFGDVRTAEEICLDMEYVSETAPDVLCSKYFGESSEPTYITGNTVGQQFKNNALTEFEASGEAPKSIEVTLMLPTAHTERAGVIFGNYNNGTTNIINLEVLAGGLLRLYYINNGVKYDYTFQTDIRSDKPINLALVARDAEVSLYINGILTETIAVKSALPVMTGSYAIGGDYRADNAQYFKGTIYSLHIFSTERSEDEITRDMCAVSADTQGLIYSACLTEKGAVSNGGQSFGNNVIGGAPCTLAGTPLTFEAVIQLSKDCAGRGGIIVSNNFKSKPIVSFEVFKNGKLRLYFVNGTTTVDCKFDTDVRSDEPIHVALSINGTTASLYINGELTEVRELVLPLPVSTQGYHVGGDFRPGNTQYFKGVIYSVGLFDHARSAEQIKQDMLYLEGESGLLFSARYIDTHEMQSKDMHAHPQQEIVRYPTADSDGLMRIVCQDCGKILSINSIPYTADPVKKNTYTDTQAALKDGAYYIVDGAFDRAPKTFEFLLKLSPSIKDRGGVILGNYDGLTINRMNLEIYTNGNPRLWYKIKGASYSYQFDVDIRSEDRVHLTFVIDGLTASLYVNGILAQTVALAAEVPYDGSNFFVATDQRISAQGFKGEIYSASIFADVRTPEEIASDMIMVTGDADALLFSEYFVASEGIQAKGPWADKTAIFVGDSITAGTNCEGDAYWKLLEQMLELRSATAMATSGSCISSTSDYGELHDPLIGRYDEIPEADLITVFMGTNDYGHDAPLGTIEDTTDVSFYGALNVIIPALLAKYPNAKIVFITPSHRYGFGTNTATGEAHTFDTVPNGAGHTLEDYVNAIRNVCEKYGVSVIDLYSNLDMDPSNEEVREYYMPDGLHPNTAGHRVIADLLAHSLEELAYSAE